LAAQDRYDKVGEELVRLITEIEAEKMISDLPESRIIFLLQPSNRRELCSILSTKLKMIKIGGVFRLETNLHRERSLLTISVDSNHRDDVIGAVDVDDQMSLADVRRLLYKEMDEDDIPTSWRFLYKNAPCSKSQEKDRLATDILPICVILTKKRRRPTSAPNSNLGHSSNSVHSDVDSEFGKQDSVMSWDSDDSSKTGGGNSVGSGREGGGGSKRKRQNIKRTKKGKRGRKVSLEP